MLLELLSIRSGLSNLTSETIYNDLERLSLISLRRYVNVYILPLLSMMLLRFIGVFIVLRVRIYNKYKSPIFDRPQRENHFTYLL